MTETPPERLHNWQHTQLSVARFYGGIKFNGHHYMITFNEPGQPLVRADVLAREAKEARAADKAQRKATIADQEKLI